MGESIKENIILSDNSVEDMYEFKEGLENSTKQKWNIIVENSNKLRKNKFDNIIRYIKYFLFPLKVFLKRKKFKNIVAWQQFYGIVFAFYCNFFKVKKNNNLTIMTFIYKEKKFFKVLYFKFIKFSIKNKYVDNIIVCSKKECEYYSNIFDMDSSIFHFEKIGINRIKVEKEYSEKGYLISIGRSNRDYEFLINSLENTKYNLKIITDLNIKSNSQNIKIYSNVYGDEYHAMLKNSFAVVIPLKNLKISSGQLVILTAMQLGIPIIITESNGIKDYVKNNYNGLLIKNNKDELIQAIEQLYNKEFYEKIKDNAYKCYLTQYSSIKLGENIGNLIV